MSKEQILSILKQNAGQYCSGEDISRTLGISRAAVSKAVANLRKEGYVITSATNRGYLLTESPDKLTEGTIRPWLRARRLGRRLICLETTDSTNNDLKRLALEGAEDGTVVVADQQTAGRGRLGRTFQSPAGTGIYISFLLRPRVMPPAPPWPSATRFRPPAASGPRSSGPTTCCCPSARSAASSPR